jgi:1-acyl-sn-glycerol-3-phosphate acyltransferase
MGRMAISLFGRRAVDAGGIQVRSSRHLDCRAGLADDEVGLCQTGWQGQSAESYMGRPTTLKRTRHAPAMGISGRGMDNPACHDNDKTMGAPLSRAAIQPGGHWLSALLARLYYHRIRVIHPERLPAAGPVLYLGLHRNGAVDGFVYGTHLPRAVFMISAQLRRNAIGRLFFRGIEVARAKDAERGMAVDNLAAMQACVDHVGGGGALFVLPEGTSDLGHRHLPFQKGAARILRQLLADGVQPAVVPLGIHYEAAPEWQSDVELVVGEPVDTALPEGLTEAEAVRLLHQRITGALEAVGVNAPDPDTWADWQRLAYAATLGTGRPYFTALKALEQGRPDLTTIAADMRAEVERSRPRLHQGVPLVPIRQAWAYAVLAALLAPPVAAALTLNLPPILAAHWAGRRFADAANTIALWRLLVGVPTLALWAGLLLIATLASGHGLLWPAYAAVSWLGLRSLYRLRKLTVSLANLTQGGGLRASLLDWHGAIDRAMKAEGV